MLESFPQIPLFPTLLSFYAELVFGRELALPLFARKPSHCQSRARTNGRLFLTRLTRGSYLALSLPPLIWRARSTYCPPACSMAAPNHKAGVTEGEHSWSMTGSVQVAPILRKRVSSKRLGASARFDLDDTLSQ